MIKFFLCKKNSLPLTFSTLGLIFARFVISSGNFVFPFLTFFLTQKLGLEIKTAGFAMSLLAIGGLLGSLTGGYIIDKLGYLFVIIVAGILCTFSYGLIPLFSSVLPVMLLLFIGFFMLAAYEPAFNTFVAATFPKEQLRTAYSAVYVAGNLGFIVGPLAASQLFNSHISFLFLGDAFATFLSCLMIVMVAKLKNEISSSHLTNDISISDKKINMSNENVEVRVSTQYLVVFCTVFFFWPLLLSQLFFAVPLLCTRIFGAEGIKYFGYLTVFNGVLVVFLSPFVSKLTKGITPHSCVILGGVFYVFGFGGLFFVDNLVTLLFFTFIWTIGEILSNPNARVFIVLNSHEKNRGRLLGMLDFSIECGYLAGPPIMGIIISACKYPELSWLSLAFFMSIGVLLLYFLKKIYISKTKANLEIVLEQ